MKWGLVAGIANPNDFGASAKDHGVVAVDSCFVQDHHPFPQDKLESFTATCDALLTTEKDFARSSSVFRRLKIPVYVLPLRVEWVGGSPRFLA
jgi:tetraacyldisaccharide-1-P 4'-kinase